MEKLNKRLNLAVNLAIIVVLVLIGIVFAKNLLSARSTPQHRDYRVPAGSKISLPGVDWASNEETLLLVLEKKCPYCMQSAPFYQQLAREAGQKGRVRLMVVLPQDVAEGKEYLDALDVPINEVRQSSFEALGVSAGQATIGMVVLPAVLGTAIALLIFLPMPSAFAYARIAESSFWIAAAVGTLVSRKHPTDSKRRLDVGWADIALLLAAALLVRLVSTWGPV